MKIHEFLDVVPRSFKRAAFILAVCSLVAGMAGSVANTMLHGALSGHAHVAPFAVGLMAAVFLTLYVLGLGYVYADARRRAMPPWLWTLIAAFIPNLLGFLLYFASRRPMALPCPHCSQANAPGQRFCSWCGHPASGPLASGGVLA